jgi:hypothetical protein
MHLVADRRRVHVEDPSEHVAHRGDGKWKIFGSWGIFYDFFKLELPRGSFGGDKWIEYYYTLDTFCGRISSRRRPARRRARARS